MPDRIAQLLSHIFHPFIVTVATFAVVAYLADPTMTAVLKWAGIYLGAGIIPAFILMVSRVRDGSITDMDVSMREHRFLFYGVGIVSLVVVGLLYWWLGAPRMLLLVLIAATVSNVVSVVVNNFTKISVHSAGMAGCTAILVVTVPLLGLVMAGITLLLGWARVR